MHPLKEFSIKNGITLRVIAKKLEIAPGYLSQIVHEQVIPSKKLKPKIEAILNGKVFKLEK